MREVFAFDRRLCLKGRFCFVEKAVQYADSEVQGASIYASDGSCFLNLL
jgi:hypothetical protein